VRTLFNIGNIYLRYKLQPFMLYYYSMYECYVQSLDYYVRTLVREKQHYSLRYLREILSAIIHKRHY